MKQSLIAFLTFTRKDRIGVLILMLLILVVAFLPRFFSLPKSRPPNAEDSAWMVLVEKMSKDSGESRPVIKSRSTYLVQHYPEKSSPNAPTILFPFDPNTLSPEDWKKLGVREKTIQIILNYRAKGGQFKQARDLRKIFGLRPEEIARLEPFVRIQDTMQVKIVAPTALPAPKTANTFKSSRTNDVEINSADTSAFIALPGIGSKLAARIVHFREMLGGFYSIDQVKETFGLPDSTFQKIRAYLVLKEPNCRKININTATREELEQHPYIRWVLAGPLLAYRDQHGPFSNLEDLKKVRAISPDLFQKLLPYLKLE